MLQFVFSTFTAGFTIFVTFFSSFIIQSWFSAYCLISVSQSHSTTSLHFHLCTATSIDYFLQLLKITGYQECTMADLVVPVPAGSGSVPKIIGRHSKLSANIYKSNSVSFELHSCRLIVISVGRQ